MTGVLLPIRAAEETTSRVARLSGMEQIARLILVVGIVLLLTAGALWVFG